MTKPKGNSKPYPQVGMRVTWVETHENPDIEKEIKALDDLYGRKGIKVLQVLSQGQRTPPRVALSWYGGAIVHRGTSNIRSFSWDYLRPLELEQ